MMRVLIPRSLFLFTHGSLKTRRGVDCTAGIDLSIKLYTNSKLGGRETKGLGSKGARLRAGVTGLMPASSPPHHHDFAAAVQGGGRLWRLASPSQVPVLKHISACLSHTPYWCGDCADESSIGPPPPRRPASALAARPCHHARPQRRGATFFRAAGWLAEVLQHLVASPTRRPMLDQRTTSAGSTACVAWLQAGAASEISLAAAAGSRQAGAGKMHARAARLGRAPSALRRHSDCILIVYSSSRLRPMNHVLATLSARL